jgi:hypothetical protein
MCMCKLVTHKSFLLSLLKSNHPQNVIKNANNDELKTIIEIIYNASKYFETESISQLTMLVENKTQFYETEIKEQVQNNSLHLVRLVASVLVYVFTESFERICVHDVNL